MNTIKKQNMPGVKLKTKGMLLLSLLLINGLLQQAWGNDENSKQTVSKRLGVVHFNAVLTTGDDLDVYNEDFTYFEPLADTVTSDMKYHTRRKEKAVLAMIAILPN